MSNELFTSEGKRKYLNAEELARFIAAAQQHERAEVRTFCLVLAYTGCRISEALALIVDSVDLSNGAITFKTLKQRDKIRYRAVPVPESTLDALDLVHGLRKAQRGKRRRGGGKLWPWGRTQGYQHVKAVMAAADIAGPQASPKGLRHGFGVRATETTRNPRLVCDEVAGTPQPGYHGHLHGRDRAGRARRRRENVGVGVVNLNHWLQATITRAPL